MAGGRRHTDARFPAALERRFPRVYMPEHELGQRYEVVPVELILAPAPISDDVSLIHTPKTRAEVAALEVAAQVRTGKRALPEDQKWNPPLIPWENNCPTVAAKRRCTDAACRWLHDDQMAGADQEKTKLRVVNLLVIQMSRGTWNPKWKLPPPPPRQEPAPLHAADLLRPPPSEEAVVIDVAQEQNVVMDATQLQQVRHCAVMVWYMLKWRWNIYGNATYSMSFVTQFELYM